MEKIELIEYFICEFANHNLIHANNKYIKKYPIYGGKNIEYLIFDDWYIKDNTLILRYIEKHAYDLPINIDLHFNIETISIVDKKNSFSIY